MNLQFIRLNSFIIKLVNNKLIKDSFWSLLGNIIGRGLALASGIFVARFLGKEIYGEYGMIKSTILSIATFSSFGLGYTATTFVAEYKVSKPDHINLFLKYATRITLILSGCMALILFIGAGYIADDILEVPHLETALKILAILIVFNGLTTTQIGVLSGFGSFKELAKINSIVGAATFFLSVILTYYFALEGALTALLISSLINWLLNYKEVMKNTLTGKNESLSDKKLAKKILLFSTPVALQEGLYSLATWASSYVLMLYASYAELGMYNAAIQWFAIILFIPGILRNVVLSHLASSKSEKQHGNIMKATIVINVIATLLPAIVVSIFSKYITNAYGQDYVGLGSLISAASFISVVASVSNVYYQAYMSKGKNWLVLIIRAVRDLGQLLLFIYITNNLGISSAMAMVVSLLTMSIISLLILVFYYKKIRVTSLVQ